MCPDFLLMLLTKRIAFPHKRPYITTFVQLVYHVGHQCASCSHVKEIRINTTSLLSRKIGIERCEPFVRHNAFHNHLTQNPFQRRTFVFLIAVRKHLIPHIKPNKMDDFMDCHPDCAPLTIKVEHFKPFFVQKPRRDRIHRDIAPHLTKKRCKLRLKRLRQRLLYLRSVPVPVSCVRLHLSVNLRFCLLVHRFQNLCDVAFTLVKA